MRESRTPGSVRGDRGNPVPYRVRVKAHPSAAGLTAAVGGRQPVRLWACWSPNRPFRAERKTRTPPLQRQLAATKFRMP